ncbi:YdcF family protein [Paenibacillus cymbidii]|uniref:YdcF family protein n=1 Tax=Paenibacillus cymbidii TaxID=1639034 RepID=UPI0010815EB3|nr:YdcF family protein [Paenibacillus cymbidii]
MIYLIKFGYSFLLPPGIFILALAAAAVWMLRKRERGMALALAVVALALYVCSTTLVSDSLVRSLEIRYEPPQAIDGDVIVVLGGGATEDTPDIDGSGNLSGAAGNRLLAAARLHFRTGLPILFSGGKVFADTGNEADIAKRQLLALGVPASAVYAENRSLNTEQNAEYTAQMMADHRLAKPLLVTSALHMKRAVMNFERAGVAVTPYPVDYRVSRHSAFGLHRLSPVSYALDNVGASLKEYLGIVAIQLFG